MVFLDSHGWPIEWVVGRPIQSTIRRILLTRKIISNKKWKASEEKRKNTQIDGCVDECRSE